MNYYESADRAVEIHRLMVRCWHNGYKSPKILNLLLEIDPNATLEGVATYFKRMIECELDIRCEYLK